MLDLVLPLQCGGCGAPSVRWCPACARALHVGVDEPRLVTPRIDPGVPVFSLGRYVGARRRAIIAAKEHGRADLIAPLGGALRAGLERLLGWGIVDTPLTVVPAPTRRAVARRRGGDPVARMTVLAVASTDGLAIVTALRMRPLVRDSVGLSGPARARNVAGGVRLIAPVAGDVVLVDDIVTTGATAAESVRRLQTSGTRVVAVLTVANA